MEKSVLKSKTFWFGLLTALASLVPAIQEHVIDKPELFGMLWGGLTVALRLITKDRVVLKS